MKPGLLLVSPFYLYHIKMRCLLLLKKIVPYKILYFASAFHYFQNCCFWTLKVGSYTRPLTVWRCNFRILSVHREPKCLGYRHNHSNAPFCFDHIGVSWFFWPEGLLRHWWSEFLKYNLLFAFEYSFRYDKCYYLFFFLICF